APAYGAARSSGRRGGVPVSGYLIGSSEGRSQHRRSEGGPLRPSRFFLLGLPHTPCPSPARGEERTTNRQRSVAPGRTNSDHPLAEGEVGKCASLPPRGGGAGGEGALPYDALFRTPPDAASPLSWRA